MSARPRTPWRCRPAAFTLIELLVVIGIIALLAAIAVPAIIGAYGKAKRTRVAADLSAIATALDAYKTDFGDYPRVEVGNTGFAVLGKTMLSPGGAYDTSKTPAAPSAAAFNGSTHYMPGDCVTYTNEEFLAFRAPNVGQGPTNIQFWTNFPYSDGVAGSGFRARDGSKVYPPYLRADKFKTRGLAIIDAYGTPILYSPASLIKVNQNTPGGFWYVQDHQFTTPVPTTPAPVWEAGHNINFFMRTETADGAPLTGLTGVNAIDTDRTHAVRRMAAFLIQNFDPSLANVGQISAGSTVKPTTMGPFILWSAGPDGFYGVNYDSVDVTIAAPTKDDISKCDDIVNFER